MTKGSLSARRAWIEMLTCSFSLLAGLSLSARRAWIEIHHQSNARRPESVALRKESVDRNIWGGRGTGKTYGSLSARRAWIEISE